jgi:hypothetical protein
VRNGGLKLRRLRLEALCAMAQLAVSEYPAPDRDEVENQWHELEDWDDDLENQCASSERDT